MNKVDIKIGFKCNNRCYFCVQGEKRNKLPMKSRAEIESSLQEGYRLGNKSVVFTGGEPTVHPDFLYFVKFAKKLGYKEIQIQTNGRMFAYADFCLKTVKAGATIFSPSLHGASDKTHDFLTRAPRSFNQTIEGIKNIKKLGKYISTNTVITSKNYQEIPDIAKLLLGLGVDQIQFAFVHILGSAASNKEWLVPKKSLVAPFVEKALNIGIKKGIRMTTEAIPYCMLPGYENCISEQIIPDTIVYDLDYVIDDYTKHRKEVGKTKGNDCVECSYYKKCEGPWKEYPEIFGWGEFKPVLKVK